MTIKPLALLFAVIAAPASAEDLAFTLVNNASQPLSNLYVVYGRGGYMLDEFSTGAGEQWRDSFSLRDSEQLLVKLAYRFEL